MNEQEYYWRHKWGLRADNCAALFRGWLSTVLFSLFMWERFKHIVVSMKAVLQCPSRITFHFHQISCWCRIKLTDILQGEAQYGKWLNWRLETQESKLGALSKIHTVHTNGPLEIFKLLSMTFSFLKQQQQQYLLSPVTWCPHHSIIFFFVFRKHYVIEPHMVLWAVFVNA